MHKYRHSTGQFLVLVIGVVLACAGQAVMARDQNAPVTAPPPNFVIFLSDDQGWGDLSSSGNTNLSTPNIDSLARDGATFDRFYVCPVCSPTRAEFLTGRYHPRGGVFSTSAGGERLDLDEVTIAEAFKAAGYVTGAFGKWHNGLQWPYHPNARGFDEFYGFCSGHWGNYFDPTLEHNGTLVRGKGFIIDDLTHQAMNFVVANRNKPFFCYIPYNTPHSPMQVPDRFYKKFEGAALKMQHQGRRRGNILHTRAALAMCENIDWNVGRMLKKLDELGIADNTVVMYFSDNGPNGWRWNGGMKGRKGSTDEGGVRSPCMIRWPKKIKPGVKVSEIAAAIDILPTFADIAGIEVMGDKKLDGLSLKSLLMGQSNEWPERMIFSRWNNGTSVRTQRYRLDGRGRLFDMIDDPGQRKDVSHAHPDAASRLSRAVADWRKDVLTDWKEDRPFPVGHSGSKVTYLPARDGQSAGCVKRSNRYPNDSFFTGWTDIGGRVSWDVEVLTAGTYQVDLYYTCSEKDLGVVVELSMGDSRVRGTITEAYDAPFLGRKNDRFPRQESEVKYFRPMTLGTIDLKAGRGKLVLRAIDIPGDLAMDVRYIVLTRNES